MRRPAPQTAPRPTAQAAALRDPPGRAPAQALHPRGLAQRQRIDASFGPVVQRLLVPFKTPAAPTPEQALVLADAATIDAQTTAAFTYTWNRLSEATRPLHPVPLTQDQFPEVTEGHFAHMVNTLGGHNQALKAAAVGYVIEDQVTHGGALPAQVVSQAHHGNAILDFVSHHGAAHGVIDITSSGQLGHVLDKSFNKAAFAYIGEATYPSIDFANLNGGAMPALGAAAAALALQAKRTRANSAMGSRLLQMRQQLVLLHEGVMRHTPGFAAAAQALAFAVNALPAAPAAAWTPVQVAHVDGLVGAANGLLGAAYALPTLSALIAEAQAHYLLAGNPPW